MGSDPCKIFVLVTDFLGITSHTQRSYMGQNPACLSSLLPSTICFNCNYPYAVGYHRYSSVKIFIFLRGQTVMILSSIAASTQHVVFFSNLMDCADNFFT
ncbi:uncharacterized protein isoform X2 [Rhodnius prolixus]|uniref:uncharacterized protein isoform X2 n=1 Tax=Rhodnius prolixus TaxID=13249 RepID=UPI003D187D01